MFLELLKILIAFVLQSFIFFIVGKRMDEENNVLWDIYFSTNIPAVIATFILGHFFKITFPLYYFSLLVMFYYIKLKSQSEKSLKNLFIYFSVCTYSGYIILMLLGFTSDMTWYVSFAFVTLTILLFLFIKEVFIGMYLLPLVSLAILIYKNPNYVNIFLKAVSGQLTNHVALIEMGFILTGMLVLLMLEVRYNRFVFVSLEGRGEYEKILKFKKKNELSSFKIPRGGI